MASQKTFVLNLFPMKILSHALLAIALAGTFASCKKDNNSTATPSPSASGPFVCKVEGAQFPTDNNKAKAKSVASTKMLQIIGQTSNSDRTVILNLMPIKAGFTGWTAGTYKIADGTVATDGYLATGSYDYWPNGLSENSELWTTKPQNGDTDGEIVITSITDTHVKGSFKFKGYKQQKNGQYDYSSTKNVTDGSFDLDITKY